MHVTKCGDDQPRNVPEEERN